MPLDEYDLRQVEKYQALLAPAAAVVRKWQIAINAVYEAAGEPPPHQFDEMSADGCASPKGRRTYARAEFFEQPLATVVKKLVTDNGPLNIDELYDLMLSGGFSFKETNPERAKSNMKISLGKNVAFGCTPKGHYALSSVSRERRAVTASKEPNGSTPTADEPRSGAADEPTGNGGASDSPT